MNRLLVFLVISLSGVLAVMAQDASSAANPAAPSMDAVLSAAISAASRLGVAAVLMVVLHFMYKAYMAKDASLTEAYKFQNDVMRKILEDNASNTALNTEVLHEVKAMIAQWDRRHGKPASGEA